MRQRLLPLIAGVLAMSAFAVSPRVQAEELGAYSGAQLYQRLCASCHGPGGAGDGPVAASFKTRIPDLTGLAARRHGEFPAERIRQVVDGRSGMAPHGARDMPVWGVDLRTAGAAEVDALLSRLVEHLRSLQKPARQ